MYIYIYILWWHHTSKVSTGVCLCKYTCAWVGIYHTPRIHYAHLRNILFQLTIGPLVVVDIEKQSFRLGRLVLFTSDSPQYLLLQLKTNMSGNIEKQTFRSV